MEVINIKCESNKISVTAEIKTFLDQLIINERDAINKIMICDHCDFEVGLNYHYRRLDLDQDDSKITDDMLELRIHIDLPNIEDNIELNSLVHDMERTHSKDLYVTMCYLTASYERTDKYTIIHEYIYKCQGFDDAYIAMSKILTDMSEEEFSQFDERLITISNTYQGEDGLLYENKRKKYYRDHTRMTINIANCDIKSNITILNKIMRVISNFW